jgi:hypothetical protein
MVPICIGFSSTICIQHLAILHFNRNESEILTTGTGELPKETALSRSVTMQQLYKRLPVTNLSDRLFRLPDIMCHGCPGHRENMFLQCQGPDHII